MTIQRVRSKAAKTEALLADASMREHVPDTRPMNRETVRDMLAAYGMIYVKPINGTFGNGVIRIERKHDPVFPYSFQSGTRELRFEGFDAMYDRLLLTKKKRPYLSQMGIELLKHDSRRFDLRVMVQMNPQSRWETTGLIGRVAHPRKIVTNYHSGGTPMPIDRLLEPHLPPPLTLSEYRQSLQQLGENTARALQRRFPRIKEIGVDVAIGTDLKPWILEVNTLPDPYLFRKLKDPAVFRRIYAYAVAYGRRFPAPARAKRRSQ